MQFLGIIPARYASTRFPGKPLVEINGKTMIERVYSQASKVLDHVYVATDDQRIESEVKRFGGKVIMTSPNHQSGTDRCAEAARFVNEKERIAFDAVINIQGDEPFIRPEQFVSLMDCFTNPQTQIATLVKPLHSLEDILNPNYVKAVVSPDGKALYFSRSPIPYLRGKDQSEWVGSHVFFKHLGIYAYKAHVLIELTQLKQSPLELVESLEQLRWLENNYCIIAQTTSFESPSVDTPEDLEKIRDFRFED